MAVHLQRPLLLLLVLTGGATLFGLGSLANGRRLGPRVLAGAMALPPMDIFGDLELTDGPRSAWAVAIFVLRVALVTAALSLVLGVPPRAKTFLKMAGIYLVSGVSISIVVLGGLGYLRLRTGPQTALTGWGSLALLMLYPVMLILLSATLAQLAARAVANKNMRPVLGKGSIWGIALVSTLIWVFVVPVLESGLKQPAGEASSVGFVLAFVILVTQSVLYGAIAIASQPEPTVAEQLTAGPEGPPSR